MKCEEASRLALIPFIYKSKHSTIHNSQFNLHFNRPKPDVNDINTPPLAIINRPPTRTEGAAYLSPGQPPWG